MTNNEINSHSLSLLAKSTIDNKSTTNGDHSRLFNQSVQMITANERYHTKNQEQHQLDDVVIDSVKQHSINKQHPINSMNTQHNQQK